MTPEEIAKLNQDAARNRYLIRVRNRNKEQLNQRTENDSATYKKYDAETETHYVYPNTPVKDLLTNSGLLQGQTVEFIDGALDSVPRRKPRKRRKPVQPDPEPVYGILVKRRAYVRTEFLYIPPKPDEYSDPVPATFYMMYYSSTFQGGAIAFWNPGYQKRYCEGGSEQLCGKDYGNPLTNLDRDIYCRNFPSTWLAVPFENFQSLGLPGRRCHYAIAIENEEGVRGLVGGIIIGAFVPASDGISEPPTVPPYAFPTVNYKIRNPLYPSGEYAPPGERYLACSVEQGDAVDMGWTLLEVIPGSPYIPPQLISPASPGGTYPSDVFESQYWLITPQGAIQVCSVEDELYPEDLRAIGQDSFEKQTTVLLAADEQGRIHVDLRIFTLDFETAQTTQSLKHYQVQGGAVTEVEQSESWRRKLTNSPTESPLPGAPVHPCATVYQASPQVNLALQAGKLIQSPLFYTMNDLREGKALDLQVWQLPGGSSCVLPDEPEQTVQIQITAFDDGFIETSPQDERPIQLVGITAYV